MNIGKIIDWDLCIFQKLLNIRVFKLFLFWQLKGPDKVSVLDTTEVYHFIGSAKPWYWYNFLFVPTAQMWHDVAKRTFSAYANALFWEYIALLYGALILVLTLCLSWDTKGNQKQKITTKMRITKTICVEFLVACVVLFIVLFMPLNMFPHTGAFLLYWFAGISCLFFFWWKEWTAILGLWIFSKVSGTPIRVDGIQIMQIFAPFIGTIIIWLYIEHYGTNFVQLARVILFMCVSAVTSAISCTTVYLT